MGKLSTKNVKEKGASSSKGIAPGNVVVRINSIQLDQPEFLKKDDGYILKMNVETRKPNDGFIGFNTDWQDKNSPTYEGQIGGVKFSSWPFKSTKTKSGVEIDRDEELMRALLTIAYSSGNKEWWDQTDGKYDSIEAMVEDFNKVLSKDSFMNMCIAGRQYMNKKGYKTWDLFLADRTEGFVSMKEESNEDLKVVVFNRDEHCDYMQNQGDNTIDGDAVDDANAGAADTDDDYDDDLGF